MIIGNFTYDKQNGSYAGFIRTLTIARESVVLTPLQSGAEKAPDYRVLQQTNLGPLEIGAAWRRSSEKGKGYVSVVLDDPALPTPINAAMFLAADETTATLVWTRAARAAAASPAPPPKERRSRARPAPSAPAR